MSSLLKGVIRNGRVEVDEPIDLPDGTAVVLTPEASRDEAPVRRRRNGYFLGGFGALPAALGSPVGGGARSSFAGGPSSSVSTGFSASAHTW